MIGAAAACDGFTTATSTAEAVAAIGVGAARVAFASADAEADLASEVAGGGAVRRVGAAAALRKALRADGVGAERVTLAVCLLM